MSIVDRVLTTDDGARIIVHGETFAALEQVARELEAHCEAMSDCLVFDGPHRAAYQAYRKFQQERTR